MADGVVIEFFFDVGSPYSYLAATQVDSVGERLGVPVRWRPFLLGGLFKAVGNQPPATLRPKARWMLDDLGRWAARYGVPFSMPSRFPLNTLKPQRALVGAGRLQGEAAVPGLARALFRAYWAEDRDVSDPAVIAEVAQQAGFDGSSVVTAASEQETKDTLRASTEEAAERGAFGAPSFFVGDALFWGNDRLTLLEDHVRSL